MFDFLKKRDNVNKEHLLDSFTGQNKIKNSLSIFIKSAKNRKEPLDHILLSGHPGCGKTTLANIIANEMQSPIITTMGPQIKNDIDLKFLFLLENNSIVFIDEIHAIPKKVEEVLYPLIETFTYSLSDGRIVQLPKFTLIGATTRIGDLSKPLRDRFGIALHLDYYTLDDIKHILKNLNIIYKLPIDDESYTILADSCKQTPRLAKHLIQRFRDYSVANNYELINKEITYKILNELLIYKYGLTSLDIRYLTLLNTTFKDRPVGLSTIAGTLMETAETIENIVEAYLINKQLIYKSGRGRLLTTQGKDYLKLI